MSGSLLLQYDLPAVAAATLCAGACALVGHFLTLRRTAMLGDAISHAVLPGIVLVFLLLGTRAPLPMLLGAGAAALLAAGVIEGLKRLFGDRLEQGAAMGIVFSAFFAMGIVLMERGARNVDLDADCVLYGTLEAITWPAAHSAAALADPAVWAAAPRQVITLAVVYVLLLAVVALFFRRLVAACFDPGFARSAGLRPGLVNFGLAGLVATAAVASFEAVGSVLVIAMLVCPGAAARQWSDRLVSQLWIGQGMAALAAVGGYVLASVGPAMVGLDRALTASGMIAAMAGGLLLVSAVVSPKHGAVARWRRRRAVAVETAREDLLATLFRQREGRAGFTPAFWRATVGSARLCDLAMRQARQRGQITGPDEAPQLTEAGLAAAAAVVRSHRLWERYLVDEAGADPAKVHDQAMVLEHAGLTPPQPGDATDPHGRRIP
ncbi:MAG: metal ABC transporter permease [Phycisphaerales bacterium]|jgi:manganese/zinc/iron transport system permease protein|nr:metal ABC transporter permease [Phycisphaerales bacterium]